MIIIRQDVGRNVRWNVASVLPSAGRVYPCLAACRHACRAVDETAASVRQYATAVSPISGQCRQTERDSPAEKLRLPHPCVLYSIHIVHSL